MTEEQIKALPTISVGMQPYVKLADVLALLATKPKPTKPDALPK